MALTLKELERYKHARVSELLEYSVLPQQTIETVESIENYLIERFGVGLAYYVAISHHMYGIGISSLSRELGVSYTHLNEVLDHYGIPILNPKESLRIYWRKPENKIRRSTLVQQLWRKREYRARLSSVRQSPEYKAKIAATWKRKALERRLKWLDRISSMRRQRMKLAS